MSAIQVDDVTFMSRNLDPRALKADKVYNTVHQYNEQLPDGSYIRKAAFVKNFGIECDVRDLQKAVDMISRVINHAYMYDPDQIKGFLSYPIFKVDMAALGPRRRCAVITYVALDDEISRIMADDFDLLSFVEGDMLKSIEDLK